MNAPVTRRTLLGATAAVGVAALPIACSALASPADLDGELFALLDAWGPARAAADVAGERGNELWDAFLERKPERPMALRHSGADRLNCGFEVEVLPSGRHVSFYGLAEIWTLMSAPLPSHSVWAGEPAPWGNGEEIGRWVAMPDERAIARRVEILAAHHEWTAECVAVRESLGIPAADEAEEKAYGVLGAIEAAILATLPRTTAGLIAKARWASWDGLPKAIAEVWAKQVTADVVAMAEHGGWAS